MQHEHNEEHPDAQPSGDYGYDAAHEPDVVPPAAATEESHPAVYVATESEDVDQDYSYDLAHDVPRMRDE